MIGLQPGDELELLWHTRIGPDGSTEDHPESVTVTVIRVIGDAGTIIVRLPNNSTATIVPVRTR